MKKENVATVVMSRENENKNDDRIVIDVELLLIYAACRQLRKPENANDLN